MRFILLETIADSREYYPNISDNDFNRVIALDPTFKREKDKLGNYGKWLLSLFSKGQLQNEGHVKDLLNRFESVKNNLKQRDIMRYKSLEEVDNMLNNEDSYKDLSKRQELRQVQKAVHSTNVNKEASKVFEDSKWEVWVPHTYNASCKLGRGTTWCTASTESDYYYNRYKQQYGGEYYILINKQNPKEKYQFHFESNQFMDADDSPVDVGKIIGDDEKLKQFFYKLRLDSLGITQENIDTGLYTFNIGLYEFVGNILEFDIGVGAFRAALEYDEDYFKGYGDGDYSNVEDYLDPSNKGRINNIPKDRLKEVKQDLVNIYNHIAIADATENASNYVQYELFDKVREEDPDFDITFEKPIKKLTVTLGINDVINDPFNISDWALNEYDDSIEDIGFGPYLLRKRLKDVEIKDPYWGWLEDGIDEYYFNDEVSDYLDEKGF